MALDLVLRSSKPMSFGHTRSRCGDEPVPYYGTSEQTGALSPRRAEAFGHHEPHFILHIQDISPRIAVSVLCSIPQLLTTNVDRGQGTVVERDRLCYKDRQKWFVDLFRHSVTCDNSEIYRPAISFVPSSQPTHSCVSTGRR
jgi:hypothetical protein